jgi:hypothetical protein
MRIDDAGVIREIGSGANTLQGWSSFVSNVWKTCGKSGAHYGANEGAKTASLSDMVNFFSLTLLQR